MYGALEYNLAWWIMALEWAMLPLIWFTNLSKPIEPLVLLALGEFAVPYCILIWSIMYLISPLGSSIREHTGVRLSISKLGSSFCELFKPARSSNASQTDPLQTGLLSEGDETKSDDLDPINDRLEHTSSPGELIREGHCIMILHVAVQLAKTLAIYLALKTDAAMAYQLTALD
jgi:hypothetical protein